MYINIISSWLLYREGPALQKWNSKWQAFSIDISQKYIYLQKYENKNIKIFIIKSGRETLNNFCITYLCSERNWAKLIGGLKGFACVGVCDVEWRRKLFFHFFWNSFLALVDAHINKKRNKYFAKWKKFYFYIYEMTKSKNVNIIKKWVFWSFFFGTCFSLFFVLLQ